MFVLGCARRSTFFQQAPKIVSDRLRRRSLSSSLTCSRVNSHGAHSFVLHGRATLIPARFCLQPCGLLGQVFARKFKITEPYSVLPLRHLFRTSAHHVCPRCFRWHGRRESALAELSDRRRTASMLQQSCRCATRKSDNMATAPISK